MKKYIVQGEFKAGTEWEKFTKKIVRIHSVKEE